MLGDQKSIKYALFADSSGKWRIQGWQIRTSFLHSPSLGPFLPSFIDPSVFFFFFLSSFFFFLSIFLSFWFPPCGLSSAVPAESGSFALRLAMPEPWRGVRDAQLSELTGIPGCIFVHANGFIGGNDTYDGVLEMARKCLAFAAAQ